jgi:threonylcarbamoyladenosine tRNA methylthiotransferase MtaB
LPEEKEEDFERTCEFILSSPFAYLHVFSYSDRKGTLSSEMQDKIEPKVIQKRSKLLHQIGKEIWEKHLNNFIGKKLEILVESNWDKDSGRLIGLTDNYIRVLIDGKNDLKNKILPVKAIGREGKYLTGEIFNG